MARPTGLTLTALGVAALAFVVGLTAIPTHVTLGAGSLRCGTVLHPDRVSEVAEFCGRAGARQLRSATVLAVVLAALATVPLGVAHMRGAVRTLGLWAWAALFLLSAIVGVAALGMQEYSPGPQDVFEL